MEWKYGKEKIEFVDDKGQIVSAASLRILSEKEVDISHVYVDPNYRGQGIAGTMMKEVAEYLRKEAITAVASCSYASSWLEKHQDEYADIMSDYFRASTSCRIDGEIDR